MNTKQFNYVLFRLSEDGMVDVHVYFPAFNFVHAEQVPPNKQFVLQNYDTFIALQHFTEPHPPRMRFVISHHPIGLLVIEEALAPSTTLHSLNPYQLISPSRALLKGNDHSLLLDWGDTHIQTIAYADSGEPSGPLIDVPSHPN